MKTNRRRTLALVLAIGLVLTSCGPQAVEEATQAAEVPIQEPLKVCFIYSMSVDDQGWNTAHERGRQYLIENVPDITSMYVDEIPDTGGADVERVAEDLITTQGCKVIVGVSFGYSEAFYNVAVRHPDVIFLNESQYKLAENIQAHYLRIWEGFYLTGMVAGKMTKSNTVGIVGSFPSGTILLRVSSFALGVQAVNPDAIVKVVWTNSWYDPGKETQAAEALIAVGADVIQHMSSSTAIIQAGEAAGVYTIGYQNDQSAFGPEFNLTSMMIEWGPIYADAVKRIQEGTWESSSFYIGLDEGVVGTGPYGPAVPDDVKELVNNTLEDIISGEFVIWCGPIKDQSGEIRFPAGECMTDEETQETDWLVEGVEGSIPDLSW